MIVEFKPKTCNRKENNLRILDTLKSFFETYPDMRFVQALWALGYETKEDLFNEEPDITLSKMIEKYAKK